MLNIHTSDSSVIWYWTSGIVEGNFFFNKRLLKSALVAYSEPCQISKHFEKIVNGFQVHAEMHHLRCFTGFWIRYSDLQI